MLIAPPHGLLRGKRARSSRRTRAPAAASVRAAVAPAGPAPTTRTSGVAALIASSSSWRPRRAPEDWRAARRRPRCRPAVGATGSVRRTPSALCRLTLPRARRASGPAFSGNGSVSSRRSTYRGSRSPRKYNPRSWTQCSQVRGVMRFGLRQHGIVRRQHRHRRGFVRDAIGADLRRIWTVLRLVELELVVLHDDDAALGGVFEQTVVVGAEVLATLVGANARDDGVVAREIARREILGVKHRHRRAKLFDGWRHLIADAHDVADRQTRRQSHVERLDRGRRRRKDVLAPRVGIFNRVESPRERLPA